MSISGDSNVFQREESALINGVRGKKVFNVGSSGNVLDVNSDGSINTLQGLEIPTHDYISLSYTGANLTGIVYKVGGSGGTTVATLTLGYDGSNNLTSVTKS